MVKASVISGEVPSQFAIFLRAVDAEAGLVLITAGTGDIMSGVLSGEDN